MDFLTQHYGIISPDRRRIIKDTHHCPVTGERVQGNGLQSSIQNTVVFYKVTHMAARRMHGTPARQALEAALVDAARADGYDVVTGQKAISPVVFETEGIEETVPASEGLVPPGDSVPPQDPDDPNGQTPPGDPEPPEDEGKDLDVTKLGLPAQTALALRGAGYLTVGDILDAEGDIYDNLIAVTGIAEKSAELIIARLIELGYDVDPAVG